MEATSLQGRRVQRVRHELRRREVQVLRVQPLGREFVRGHASSPGVLRSFCAACGSPLTWHQAEGEWRHWISIALGTLDTPFIPNKQRQVHAASRPSWASGG